MPLLPDKLKEELQRGMDQKFSGFDKFPENALQAADLWANAVFEYSKGVIQPSTTASTAKSAMQATLLGAVLPGAWAAIFPTALTSYAATLGLGMAGYTSVPPVFTPAEFQPVWAIGFAGGTSEAVIDALVQVIDTKFKTGVWTLIAPPNTTGPWS